MVLPCPLIVRAHLRLQTDAQPPSVPPTLLSLFPIPHPLSVNSHGIILFADPHPLNPIESYRFKNHGGGRDLRLFNLYPISCPLSPFLSCSYALFCTFLRSHKTQLFCFQSIPHSFAKTHGAGYPLAWHT